MFLLETSTSSLPRSHACSKGLCLGFGLTCRVLGPMLLVLMLVFTCEKDWASPGGTRRDFILGCPLAAAALESCWVDCSRWIQPHFR